ncbi:MAG: efflux RND transporter periplasmic adaptor subunit [Pseudomonadales bacterium]
MFSVRPWAAFAIVVLLANVTWADARSVSSLGRIEPHQGVVRLAGPSELAVVSELLVEEGDRIAKGQVLARLDSHAVRAAELKRAEVALAHAQRVLARQQALKKNAFSSEAGLDDAQRDVEVAEADLAAARAQLDRASIRAPVAGQVLAVHARAGERIGPEGLLELGQTQRMYVVAEVYETDIAQVTAGQPVTASSPALPGPVTGRVERIGQLVARNDVLGLDPVARIDARVIEVFILLDDPEQVSGLTNLQVDVEFGS